MVTVKIASEYEKKAHKVGDLVRVDIIQKEVNGTLLKGRYNCLLVSTTGTTKDNCKICLVLEEIIPFTQGVYEISIGAQCYSSMANHDGKNINHYMTVDTEMSDEDNDFEIKVELLPSGSCVTFTND